MGLAALFAIVALALAAVSAYALAGGTNAGRLVVGIAGAAVAVWLASLSLAAFRRRR